MHFLDDIENINAEEWNEVAEDSYSPLIRTECEPSERPDPEYCEKATANLSVCRRNEQPGVPRWGINTYIHVGRKDHNTLFSSQKVPVHRNNTPNGKRQAARPTEWSKTHAVNTRRMQAHRNQEAGRVSHNKRFLGQSPRDNFPAVGYYRWSDSTSTPSALLGESLQLLDDVRTGCEVFIDYEQRLECIRIRSYNLLNIEKGIAEVKAKIKHAEADIAALAPLYLVEPPSNPAVMSEVTPKFKRNENIHQQLVVQRVVFSGLRLSTGQATLLEAESKTILKVNQEMFSRHLKQAMFHLQNLRSDVHMRVSLGQFQLLMYRKDFRESPYSFQKFSAMMSESRTKAFFDQSIRLGEFGTQLLDSIRIADTIFEPADSTTACLAAVEPKHSLMVIFHGSTGAKLRVEADMDMVEAAPEGLGRRIWQVGAAIYYIEKDRKTRFTAGTVSLESFDWCLEIISEGTMLNPPEAFKEILAAVAVARSVYGIEGTNFRFPLVTPRVPLGVTIDEYWMRSVLRYQLVGTSYIIEVAIYRGWPNGDIDNDLRTEFRISFYHAGWDILMGPKKSATYHNDWDWNSFFPANSARGDGFGDFLTSMRTLQTFFSRLYGISHGAQ